MCTVILKSEKNYPKIAEEDIIVYKACHRIMDPDRHLNPNMVTSACMCFKYVKDILNVTEFSFTKDHGFADFKEHAYFDELVANGISACFVKHGFHAYISLERCRSWEGFYCKFIIPKGSKYYENASGCICSNQIIFKEMLA